MNLETCTNEEFLEAKLIFLQLEHPVEEAVAVDEVIFPGDLLSDNLKRSCFAECEYVAITGADIGDTFKYTRKDW